MGDGGTRRDGTIDPAVDPETARTLALLRAEIARVPNRDARERLDHLLDRLLAAFDSAGAPAPAVVQQSLTRAVAGVDYLNELAATFAEAARRVHGDVHALPGAPPAPAKPLPPAGS